jgi:hypothetical protein
MAPRRRGLADRRGSIALCRRAYPSPTNMRAAEDPVRATILACALDQAGLLDASNRGQQWSRELAGDPGGIAAAVEALLAGDDRPAR